MFNRNRRIPGIRGQLKLWLPSQWIQGHACIHSFHSTSPCLLSLGGRNVAVQESGAGEGLAVGKQAKIKAGQDKAWPGQQERIRRASVLTGPGWGPGFPLRDQAAVRGTPMPSFPPGPPHGIGGLWPPLCPILPWSDLALCGAALEKPWKLQLVRTAAVDILTRAGYQDHVLPLLFQLHRFVSTIESAGCGF